MWGGSLCSGPRDWASGEPGRPAPSPCTVRLGTTQPAPLIFDGIECLHKIYCTRLVAVVDTTESLREGSGF
jgi:hypothetical protein